MKVEVRQGKVFLDSILSDSGVRIERQPGNAVCILIHARDNSGQMHIESHTLPLSDITDLPETPGRFSYRSPTEHERSTGRIELAGKSSLPQSVWQEHAERVQHHFNEACRHMNPAQLTDDQRSAIALMAGARFSIIRGSDGAARMQVEPCRIELVDGKWRVILASLVSS